MSTNPDRKPAFGKLDIGEWEGRETPFAPSLPPTAIFSSTSSPGT